MLQSLLNKGYKIDHQRVDVAELVVYSLLLYPWKIYRQACTFAKRQREEKFATKREGMNKLLRQRENAWTKSTNIEKMRFATGSERKL